jgi:hypothetical protein
MTYEIFESLAGRYTYPSNPRHDRTFGCQIQHRFSFVETFTDACGTP